MTDFCFPDQPTIFSLNADHYPHCLYWSHYSVSRCQTFWCLGFLDPSEWKTCGGWVNVAKFQGNWNCDQLSLMTRHATTMDRTCAIQPKYKKNTAHTTDVAEPITTQHNLMQIFGAIKYWPLTRSFLPLNISFFYYPPFNVNNDLYPYTSVVDHICK